MLYFRPDWACLCRKLFTAFLLYGTAFHLWSSFVLLQFDAAPEDDDVSRRPSMSEKYARTNKNEGDIDTTGDMEDFDEDPIHIPLSWPRRHEGKFYAASDPEWQEFVKLARDHKKIRSLKGKLLVILQDISCICAYVLKMNWQRSF